MQDHWKIKMPGRNLLTFDFKTDQGVDGISFQLSKDAKEIRFNLMIDGTAQVDRVFVGQGNHHPQQSPFTLPAHGKPDKKKVIAASVYPMVLFSGMFGLMYVMLTRVLPQFTEFYGSLGAQLPLPTRVLMGVSDQARQWSLPLLAVLILGGFAVVTWLQAPQNRERFDGWILNIPFFGALMRTYSTSQLARSLSTLLSGGLPLVQALGVAAASVGNRAISASASAAVPQIQEGKSLSLALDATGHVEPLTVEMIRVGENTGALGEMLNQVADFYDEDLEVKVQTILALVEPVLLVFMAVVIGSMVLALYLPMFEAFSALQSRGGV